MKEAISNFNFHQFCQKRNVISISIISIVLTSLLFHHEVKSYYQLDFSAYYAAAKAIDLGNSPYAHSTYKHDNQDFKHTAFLQFPIVANFFRPMTFFPYRTAKSIWFFIQVGLLFGVLFFLSKNLNVAIVLLSIILIIMPFVFFPLFTHWERGQTDLVVLFSIAWSKYLWDTKKSFLGGFVLGIGCIFKFPIYFLFSVPFFSKNWRFLLGGVIGVALLVCFTLSVDGLTINKKYLTEYLPHLAETGKLPLETYNVEEMFYELFYKGNDRVIWEGNEYLTGTNFSAIFGSLSHYVQYRFNPFFGKLTGILGLLITLFTIFWSLFKANTVQTRKLVWLLAMTAVLLFHPLTWIMNYVWTIFIFIELILVLGYKNLFDKKNLILTVVFVLIGISEPFILPIIDYLKNLSDLPHFIYKLVDFFSKERLWVGGLTLWIFLLFSLLKPNTTIYS